MCGQSDWARETNSPKLHSLNRLAGNATYGAA
jgi:hypothetical protein